VRWLAALAACAACTNPVPVLELRSILDCEQARLGADGDSCALPEACLWSEPSVGGGCCTVRAACRQFELAIETGCGSTCDACPRGDLDCPFGAALCLGGLCTPCPRTDGCPPCPAGWVPFGRNGCPTCECTPPSQCDVFVPASCPAPDRCYIGAFCAEGCDAFDCCVNVCSNGDCIPIAFEGCPVPCTRTPGCSSCALEQCECLPGGTWSCRERCVPPGSVRACKATPHGVEIRP
jgi:hypothetical protein